jgi:nucleotide-binding universal stress UspA family protein
MKIKKILNPVDGSDHSMRATEHAIELAKLMNSEIVLLHCHDKFPTILAEPSFQQAVNAIIKAADELVAPFIKKLEESGLKFDVRLLEGNSGNRIPDVVSIEKIDMIVMGSRGVTDFVGLLIGSVAHQVIHKADCPVFITK